jgi:hypothetical protein
MQEVKCRNCGSHSVRVKEIELRHINPRSMALRSREIVRESECKSCGLVLSLPARQVAHV